MGRVSSIFKSGIVLSLRYTLWALRMAIWKLLTFARGPVKIVFGLVTVSGWIGGVILMPALLWYANEYKGSEFGLGMFALYIGTGIIMGLVGPVILVKYDSLLFRLQPEDRITIYT